MEINNFSILPFPIILFCHVVKKRNWAFYHLLKIILVVSLWMFVPNSSKKIISVLYIKTIHIPAIFLVAI